MRRLISSGSAFEAGSGYADPRMKIEIEATAHRRS